MAMIDEELGIMALPSPANPMNRDAELAGQDLENLGKDVLTKVQETYDLVKPEVQTITAGVLSSGKRLDTKPRVFASVPNSLLVYGGLAVVLYFILKK
jgi:hypothetical protein